MDHQALVEEGDGEQRHRLDECKRVVEAEKAKQKYPKEYEDLIQQGGVPHPGDTLTMYRHRTEQAKKDLRWQKPSVGSDPSAASLDEEINEVKTKAGTLTIAIC